MIDLERLDLQALGILIAAQRHAAKCGKADFSSADIVVALKKNAQAKRLLKANNITGVDSPLQTEPADIVIARANSVASQSGEVHLEHLLLAVFHEALSDKQKQTLAKVSRSKGRDDTDVVFDSFKLAGELGSKLSVPEHLFLVLLKNDYPPIIGALKEVGIERTKFEKTLAEDLQNSLATEEESLLNKIMKRIIPTSLPAPSKRMYSLVERIYKAPEISKAIILKNLCESTEQEIMATACLKLNTTWDILKAALEEEVSKAN